MLRITKNKHIRRMLLIAIDSFMLFISYLITFISLEFNIFNFNLISSEIYKIYIFISISILIYIISGQYKSLSEYFNRHDLYKLVVRNSLSILIYTFIGKIIFENFLENNFIFFIWIFSNIATCSIRLLIREYYLFIKYKNPNTRKSVAIYGAGEAGASLNYLLSHNKDYKVEALIDDCSSLWGREISGIKIYSPKSFFEDLKHIKTVLLSIPSLGNRRKREIINQLEINNKSVYKIPTLKDINEGKAKINDLRPIDIDDLLDRDLVKADKNIMSKSIAGFNVCITGAGGSIGSEMVREILKLQPNRLVLLERNEPSLYRIENELLSLNTENVNVRSYLGSAANEALVDKIFKENDVDIVFHSAAYKHVNVVQKNPVQGILNNVFSTLNICYRAKENNLKKVILISTDKAVRPSNIMGASKRLCELIIQAFSKEQGIIKVNNINEKIIFSKVRFGNVLGSSGSVVPLFKNQLKAGGPITLTHKDVVRYFMTINEAVQLVIQASALAKGGDLFLLNMGNSVRIYDLAKKMIKLSGLTIKDENKPDGDIEIIITGLRPGEKLFEELLVEKNAESTIHPLIFKAQDQEIDSEFLFKNLKKLKASLISEDKEISLTILSKLIPEWRKD